MHYRRFNLMVAEYFDFVNLDMHLQNLYRNLVLETFVQPWLFMRSSVYLVSRHYEVRCSRLGFLLVVHCYQSAPILARMFFV